MFNLNFIKPLNLTSSLHKVQEMKKKKITRYKKQLGKPKRCNILQKN